LLLLGGSSLWCGHIHAACLVQQFGLDTKPTIGGYAEFDKKKRQEQTECLLDFYEQMGVRDGAWASGWERGVGSHGSRLSVLNGRCCSGRGGCCCCCGSCAYTRLPVFFFANALSVLPFIPALGRTRHCGPTERTR
jgi:hypothetical protein